MNHYEFFGISRDATDDEIKNAYKRMAKKYHPDVSEGCSDDAHEKMQRINEAYSVLGNNALREEYDYSLWQEERAGRTANYDHEFRDYVPRGSRINPGEAQSQWQKYYKKPNKPGGIFTGKPMSAGSAKARKIMRVVWALRIVIPAVVVFVVAGIIFKLPFALNTIDMFYGRGTPKQMIEMYFRSIKEENFDRTMQLSTPASSPRGTEMMGLVSALSGAYAYEADGIPFGEIWFENTARELSFRVIKVERTDFNFASVTVEVKNLNAEKIFTLAQLNIENDLRKGTGKMVLLNAISDKDFSLVGDVYREYFNEMAAQMPDEYIKATVVILLTRPAYSWVVRNVDDFAALKNVLLGGFGEGADNNFANYLYIDWYKELRIENE